MDDAAIVVKDLTFSYGNATILDNASFTIETGSFVGIFGPNGGGKTTLLKLLMGFLRPTKGQISLFQLPPQQARSLIGYVPQALSCDKQFPISTLEVVLMGQLSTLRWWGGYSKEVQKNAYDILESLGLSSEAHKPFGALSGGQAQRALIARALMGKPQILLLDEPTANIDTAAQQEIYKILKTLSPSITILMVSHDLQTILDRAEKLLCVQRQVTTLLPKEVCQHFALGLYHSPLTPPPSHAR